MGLMLRLLGGRGSISVDNPEHTGTHAGHSCKGREIEAARDRRLPRHLAAASCLVSCLALLLCGSVAHAQSVAFINPGKSDEIYWMTATQGMQAVAHSLGMTFEVQYAQREPLKTFEIARELVARAPGKRPDYIVLTDDYSVDKSSAVVCP